jgi:hypothetical protein
LVRKGGQIMELKGLKLVDIENNGYYMTLTFEGGYILEVSTDSCGENMEGEIKKIEYTKVGTI